ncbi:MAG TPA: ATP-binding protein [Methanocorpusculum sp.]|nr:ATP-binding protein [Methanocorpusculum sp.]
MRCVVEISREKYLTILIKRKHNGLIKVITGLRRVGKSYLLFRLFYRHLIASGIDESHIIKIAFDNPDFEDIKTAKEALAYIWGKMTDTGMYYVLLDEVQYLEHFEGALNALLYLDNVDVYVTGSNSKFLSRDVLTEFRGRGDEVHVYPLTFAEFMSVYAGNVDKGFEEYLLFGGMPFVLQRETPEEKAQYLASLFEETYLKDIITRYHFKNHEDLSLLLDVISSVIGSLTNPLRISNTFSTVFNTPVSRDTISSYLKACEDAFLISSAKRYDIRGRQYIGTPLKYYFEDLGLRNVRLNFRQHEETYLMENAIYNELRYRGFSVDVGVVERREKTDAGTSVRRTYEIDFVANRGSARYYIQSAYAIPDDEKLMQESRSLLLANDSFKKLIVVKDPVVPRQNENGILMMGIVDFLLDEHSLDRV